MGYLELSEKQRKQVEQYRLSSHNEYYEEKNEEELFETAKSLRLEADMPTKKINPEMSDDFNNFIYTKPKQGSPAFSFGNQIKEEVELLKHGGELVRKGAAKGLGLFAAGLDKIDDVLVKKGIAGLAVNASIVYSSGKELVESFKEDRDFDILNTARQVEDTKEAVEYAFGTKLTFSDYGDFRTSQEKRNSVIANKSKAEQDVFKELDNVALMIDISAGILAGVGVSKGLSSLALKGGYTGRVAGKLAKVIDPSLSNMAKVGAVVAAAAVPYYGVTGKWIFEGDQAATEGAGVVMGSLGLKVGGEGISYLMRNKAFREGVSSMMTELKDKTGDLADKYADFSGARSRLVDESKFIKVDELTKKERSEVYKKTQELAGFQEMKGEGLMKDTETFHPKADNIKDLRSQGLLKYTGTKGNIASFEWTDEGRKLLPKWAKTKGLHHNVDLYQKVTGDILEESTDDIAKIVSKEVNTSDGKALMEELKSNRAELTKNKKDLIKKNFSETYDSIVGRVVKNADRKIGEMLGDKGASLFKRGILVKAERGIQRELEGWDINNKISRIKGGLDDVVVKINEDEYAEFNEYLFAKNRAAKTDSYKNQTGKDLLTSRETKGGTVTYTKDEMDSIINTFEPKYKELAQKVYDINKETLDLEVLTGVRTQKEADEFLSSNPFYVPDRLDSLEVERFINRSLFKPEVVKLGARLSGGSETLKFNHNSLDSLYKQLAYRTHISNRAGKIATLLAHGEELGIVRVAKKGEKASKELDEEVVETFINGERELVIMPKFFAEELSKDEGLSSSLAMRSIAFVTGLVKQQATGVMAPGFQLVAPTYEAINAAMKVWANGDVNDVGRYVKNLYNTLSRSNKGDTFINSEKGKEAIDGLMDWYGGNWSHIKMIKEETFGNGFGELKGQSKLNKLGTKVSNIVNFGHLLEKGVTRRPVFEAMLNKQFKESGLDYTNWNKMVDSATEPSGRVNIAKLTGILKQSGISPEKAGTVAKQVFNYTVGTKTVRELSRILPYFSTAVAGNVSIKQLIEDNPRKAIAMISAIWLLGDTVASFNSGTKGMLGVFEEDGEKQQKFEGLDSYQKHSFGFLSLGDEETHLTSFGKNVTFLRWLYPLIVASKDADIRGDGIDWKEGFGTTVQDATYFVDLNNKLFPGVNVGATPPGIKQILEVATNKDFFFGSDIAKGYKEHKLLDDRGASVLTKKIAYAIAGITGGKLNEAGFMEGGMQIAPAKLQRIIQIGDPSKKVTSLMSDLISRLENGEGDAATSKNLYNLFVKTYKASSVDYDEVFDIKNTQREISEIDGKAMKDRLKRAKDPKSLVESYKTEAYSAKDDKEKVKKITKEFKYQMIGLKYSKELELLDRNYSGANMARYATNKYKGKDLIKFIDELYKSNKDGLIGKSKIDNFNKEIRKIISEKK